MQPLINSEQPPEILLVRPQRHAVTNFFFEPINVVVEDELCHDDTNCHRRLAVLSRRKLGTCRPHGRRHAAVRSDAHRFACFLFATTTARKNRTRGAWSQALRERPTACRPRHSSHSVQCVENDSWNLFSLPSSLTSNVSLQAANAAKQDSLCQPSSGGTFNGFELDYVRLDLLAFGYRDSSTCSYAGPFGIPRVVLPHRDYGRRSRLRFIPPTRPACRGPAFPR